MNKCWKESLEEAEVSGWLLYLELRGSSIGIPMYALYTGWLVNENDRRESYEQYI